MKIAAVRHVPHEGLGSLENIFEERGVSFQYLDAFQNPFPAVDLEAIGALVVLGGSMGVYESDRHPFLLKEIELLKKAIEKKIPTLGICLGSQLLAAAGGAKVYRGPAKEIGWFPVQVNSAGAGDPLLKYCAPESMVFHWHGDTFDLPPGAVHLASSGKYHHQGYRIGERAWGFQFHLEMTEPMIRNWVDVAEEKSKVKNPDFNACEILTQTPCYLPEMEALARKVFGEFISLAKSSAAC